MTMEWEEMVFLTNSTEADEASPAPEADDGDMYPNRKAATIIGITKREFVIAVRFSSPNFPTICESTTETDSYSPKQISDLCIRLTNSDLCFASIGEWICGFGWFAPISEWIGAESGFDHD
ncbi:unnamed protein product [Ilex paraguariensis]|uniref:Uncharacterized protein n=1 Tax=Ilex paraguariensis TaxID=185542 RepID=A0ABC8UB67_9AQUA